MEVIEIIGLVLNMGGTALAFWFGFPQPDLSEDVSLGLEINTPIGNGLTVKDHAKNQRGRKKLQKNLSYCALGLIFSGFLLQLVAIIFH